MLKKYLKMRTRTGFQVHYRGSLAYYIFQKKRRRANSKPNDLSRVKKLNIFYLIEEINNFNLIIINFSIIIIIKKSCLDFLIERPAAELSHLDQKIIEKEYIRSVLLIS
jgi:hypothetical protein